MLCNHTFFNGINYLTCRSSELPYLLLGSVTFLHYTRGKSFIALMFHTEILCAVSWEVGIENKFHVGFSYASPPLNSPKFQWREHFVH